MTTLLGERIKSRRVLCWLTQDEFAKRVGVSRRQVAYWESNKDAPSAESIRRISIILNVSADWLLTGKGWLRDVYDPDYYSKRRDQHFSKIRANLERIKIPIFNSLPLALEKRTAAYAVSADDREALAFSVTTNEHSPVYYEGDVLLMKPLNIFVGSGSEPEPKFLSTLNGKHAAIVLNGNAAIKQLELKPNGSKALQTRLYPIPARNGKTRAAVTLEAADELTIQAVVYKCVRHV